MPILLMLGWWYSRGWFWTIELTKNRLNGLGKSFAVGLLLRTWFAPWKQIYAPSSFSTFFRDAVDNAISRCIGAVVRGAILFAVLVMSIFIILFGLISFAVWPFIPLLVILLPILTIAGAGL